tara:strand:- start:69 stop:359 length:291 start_codon:yes stop_codon:yes gene_type:complete
MYWTSEDIQPSVDLAEKLFGKSGIYSHNKGEDVTHSNVFLLTREFGKLWQGSVKFDQKLRDNMEMLSDTINKKVYLTNGFDYDNPIYTTVQRKSSE